MSNNGLNTSSTTETAQAADSEQIQQYYKSLMKVERSFRIVKSGLHIRPIRHWNKRRITAHIYLNYLALWLVTRIENHWRNLGHSGEVIPTLRRWDDGLRYVELIDKNHQTSAGFEWTRGAKAQKIIEEIDQLGGT